MDLISWGLPQLQKLLPLDEESLHQVITYADTLPKDQSAEHLKNLLGDSPQALEFIATFNQRRRGAPASENAQSKPREDINEVPKPAAKRKKQKAPLHGLPARKLGDQGDTSGAYIKKDEDDYMPAKAKAKKDSQPHSQFALQQNQPDALQLPNTQTTSASPKASPRLPPSAAGQLISDSLPVSRNTSRNASRNASPAPKPKTKVNIVGGTAMQGQSTVLNDLDSAIRTLEIQTNPSLMPSAEENAKRRCKCMATRHPLLEAAPNCLNCGKIICIKEGLGPCTFCGNTLLSQSEIQAMIRILKDERGKERMQANNAAYKRADVSAVPRPFANRRTPPSSAPTSDSESEQLEAARRHRDKLLNFQAQNARRTRIHDEAADFETPDAGTNMWATPQERALQLKRQQKILRENEWNARPEYEKRRVVASLDLAGGKVVKRMAPVERPKTPESEEDEQISTPPPTNGGSGAFSKNPLLGKLIRPVAKVDVKGKAPEREREREREREPMWRRVQDDEDDNERWILDGGLYGGRETLKQLESEEPPCG
jgi:hypothetical protein